jgi:membrane-anchored protein YejM (alkaline phosphatase superfamily)
MNDGPLLTPRSGAIRFLAAMAMLNLPVALVASARLLEAVPAGTTAVGWFATFLAWVSTLATFLLIALVLILAPVVLWPRRRFAVALAVPVFVALQFALFADAIIFGLFRCHYNQMVWDALTSPAAADSISVGTGTIVSTTLAIVLIILAVGFSAWIALRPRVQRFLRPRWLAVALALVLMLILADKGVFVWGDLNGRVEISRVSRIFPFYQRVSMRRFMVKHGWIATDDLGKVSRSRDTLMRYPCAPVPLPADPRRLNVLILIVEGGRSDMVTPDVMPNLHAFAATHTWCRNHYSGGNATRFGVFSLLYGMHATYWQSVLAERQGPFLVTALRDLGYRIAIQSCTDLSFPEFRHTAFVDVQNTITDRWGKIPRFERDRAMSDNLIRFMTDATNEPFFAVGFYDAPHAIYRYPPDHEVFTPVATEQEIDYLHISGASDASSLRPLFNRYRNSLHYVDEQVGRIVRALEEQGLMDRTLVVITGDHGQEFGELGFYGHNSTFSRFQVQVGTALHVPGLAPGPIDRMTSHVDIVPTLLTALGFTAPTSHYSHGVPLTAATDRDYVVAVSWDSLALIDREALLVRGFEGYNLTRELLDRDYNPLPTSGDAWESRKARFVSVMSELRRFSQ